MEQGESLLLQCGFLRALSVGNRAKANIIYSETGIVCALTKAKRELLLPDIWLALPSGKTLFIKFHISH